MAHRPKTKELVLDAGGREGASMVIDVIRVERSLIGASRGCRSSTGSADSSTSQRTKYRQAESPTPETQLETNPHEDPHSYLTSVR